MRLRVVVFTSEPVAAVELAFLARLSRDPSLDLRAIVVSGAEPPRRPSWARRARGLRHDGWRWLWFTLAAGLGALARRGAVAVFERVHRPIREESLRTLADETGVAIRPEADPGSEESLARIRSLCPQLGVILGRRSPGAAVTSIPECGTLQLRKYEGPEDAEPAPSGYWEALAGEGSFAVSVSYAGAEAETTEVVAETFVPIDDCDTLASLGIKADLAGARLYHDTIRAFAAGERPVAASRPRPAHAGLTPSPLSVWRLERRLRLRAARRMPVLRDRPAALIQARVLLQYVLVSPLLLWVRRQLQMRRRSPVCVLFYHLVANRPLNHMCLPLEQFARQMAFLRRHYRLVSLEQAAVRLGRGSDEVAVAITFDDGYRDNVWAIEYLRHFEIPACFFVSIGNVLDGRRFEHDRQRGFETALPFVETDVRQLAADGFEVGSHGLHHEDFGTLDAAAVERVLSESRRTIAQTTGAAPVHFSFPKGQRGVNITPESFRAALRHYRYVYSAYGGYNIPGRQTEKHLLRLANPADVVDLAMTLDGYTGLRQCLLGNAWGVKTSALRPYEGARMGR